jgi:small subunit ribosomal protein S8e
MTKLGATRIHDVRVRGGNTKHRALRLDTGNYSWGSEGEYYTFYLLSIYFKPT